MSNLVSSNLISGSIPSIFGNGILGTTVTGLIRVPAFMANCTAILMVGELAIRGLSQTLTVLGFQQKDDSFISKAAETITQSGIRPYKTWDAGHLVVSTVAFAALGIVGSEFVRVSSGTAPSIYNNILTFLGPLRIDNTPYLTAIGQLLGRAW